MSLKFAILWLCVLIPKAWAADLRVATFNVGANFITTSGGAFVPNFSLGDPGTVDHEKVKDILARIDADVVALEEIHSVDIAGDLDDVDALAASLGYSYSYISPATNAFDSTLRVIFLSRFPFLTNTSINSPAGAKEITRLFPAVKVDVPGTDKDPLLIAAHLKSGTTAADRFRRAVEMRRLAGHLILENLSPNDNYIIMGDFNLSSINRTFETLPTGLPSTYVLGTDIAFPITYSTNPLDYFSSGNLIRLDPRQLDNSASTFESGSVLDLFLVSPAIAARPFATEIYNSTLDTSNTSGLPKSGMPLVPDTSALASDHYALFADFQLENRSPFAVTITQSAAGLVRLAFPTKVGSSYTVQTSLNLSVWNDLSTHPGTGAEIMTDFSTSSTDSQRFYRVRSTTP
jgi:endonuclease/exonuclease/phosphatase family metal-dependent hydrolase